MITLSGMVCKSSYLDALELSFILNLVIFVVATYHVTLLCRSQTAVVYTSVNVAIAFLTLVGIVTYIPHPHVKSAIHWSYQLLHRNDNCHRRCKLTVNIQYTEINIRKLQSTEFAWHKVNCSLNANN